VERVQNYANAVHPLRTSSKTLPNELGWTILHCRHQIEYTVVSKADLTLFVLQKLRVRL